LRVSSKVGISGNEKADAMAYKAVTTATTHSITKIPAKDLINEAQK